MNARETVLDHLRRKGHIAPFEAMVVHKIARLAPRICELRQMGYRIRTVERTDTAGDRYFRYELNDFAA